MGPPILHNIRSGTTTEINNDTFTIGRSLRCSLVLEDLSISRVHCSLTKVSETWYLTDMSSNYTMLNGIPLDKRIKYELKHNDKIRLGIDVDYQFSSINVTEPLIPSNSNDDTVLNILDSFNETVDMQKPGAMSNNLAVPHAAIKKKFGSSQVIDLVNISDDEKSATVLARSPPKMPKPGNSPRPSTSRKAVDELNEIQEELICSVCTEVFMKAVILNCQHTFCAYCIKMWKRKKKICPVCRGKITSETTSVTLNNIIDKVLQSFSAEEKKRREELTTQRELKMKGKPKKQTKGKMRGRGRNVATRQIAPPAPLGDFMEISSSSDDDDDDFYFLDDMEDDWNYDFEDEYYTGRPEPYYGGYGNCYFCHMPGHWANNCPHRN